MGKAVRENVVGLKRESVVVYRGLHLENDFLRDLVHSVIFPCVLSGLSHHFLFSLATDDEIAIHTHFATL